MATEVIGLMVVLLFMSIIESQRVTLMSSTFNTNLDGWTVVYEEEHESNEAEIDREDECPSGYQCLVLGSDDAVSRIISTKGYHSIEFSYSYLSRSLDSGEACEFWYTVGSNAWTIAYSAQSDRVVTDVLIELNEAEDNENIGLRLYASDRRCYFNDAILTGIAITASPTSIPTENSFTEPSISPSFHPISVPTKQPC